MTSRFRWYLLFLVALAWLPGQVWALDVLVNQVGFEPNAHKMFRVQRSTDYAGNGTFSVRRSSDNVQVASGTLTRKGGLWNKYYWEGDFSSYVIPGDYYIAATVSGESANSYGFNISPNVLQTVTGTLTYQYFWTQRCGVAVSGWHAACHLDDGIRDDNNQHMDVVGGWHDAGDYNKFADVDHGDAVYDLNWLYESNPAYYDAIDTNSNGVPDLIDEILHGAHWLVKMVLSDGYVMHSTKIRRSGATWVRPENDTDNTVGNSDDRWIVRHNDAEHPQAIMVCAALIKTHQTLAAKGLPTENFAAKALAVWDHRVAWAQSQGHTNLGNYAAYIYAGMALYSVYGQQNCYDLTLGMIDGLSNAINANPAYYDNIDWDVCPGRELGALAWFARNYPATYPANNARNAVQALMTHYIDLANDPIALMRRNDGGTLQYFKTNPDWNGFFLGLNRLYLITTWGAVEAYKLLGNADYLRFAVNQYNWVMGANYDRVCMMEGAGDYNLNKYHTRYDTIPGHSDGAQPGVVPNGYIREYSTGLPKVDLTGNRYQSNEGWQINNSTYAMALSAMTVFRDTSAYVSDTIPAQMTAGQTYSVSVTMRNTSYMPWSESSTGYRLGAVGDSDPFAGGRQFIAAGTTVGNNQTYTFTFNMTAPTTPGTYTTDWRMVHEAVCWFGATLTKQVQVSSAPYVEVWIDLDQSDVLGGVSRPIPDVPDGNTIADLMGGIWGRRTDWPLNAPDGINDYYMYFKVSDTFAFQGSRPDVYIKITYWDAFGGTSPIYLQYDGAGGAYTTASTSAPTNNSSQWKTFTYHLTDAYFGNRQNSGADFRFMRTSGYISLNTVQVANQPPP